MSIEKPKNCNEWVQYVLNVIKDEDLLHQAKIIASPSFEDKMYKDGLTAGDLLSIYRAVALRFKKSGFRMPSKMSGTSVNYLEISQHDVPSEVE
tara:strand:- start:33 stop:314 length:282 start_codon:yes stop_codon:yes gene_type:complete